MKGNNDWLDQTQGPTCAIVPQKVLLTQKSRPDPIQARANELLAKVQTRGLKHALHELLKEKCEREEHAAQEIQEMKKALREVLEDNERLLSDMMEMIEDNEARKNDFELMEEEIRRLTLENEELRKSHSKQKFKNPSTPRSSCIVPFNQKPTNCSSSKKQEAEVGLGFVAHTHSALTRSFQDQKFNQDGVGSKLLEVLNSEVSLPDYKMLVTDRLCTASRDHVLTRLKDLPLSKHGCERLELLRRMRYAQQQDVHCDTENFKRNENTGSPLLQISNFGFTQEDSQINTSSPRPQLNNQRENSPKTEVQHEKDFMAPSELTKQENESITFDKWFTSSSSEVSEMSKNRRDLRQRYYYGYSNSTDSTESSTEEEQESSESHSQEALFTIRVNPVHLDDISSCMTESACTEMFPEFHIKSF